MRIVLLGAPGAGKGTQGRALAEQFGVPHVSSGELLRAEMAADSDVGRQVRESIARGELVPDDLVLSVVGRAVNDAMQTGGYILDGFPRTLEQAKRAFELAEPAGIDADYAIYLAVPDDVVRERLARRAEGRVDDGDPAVVQRRLDLFHAETEPLLEFYRDRGILREVDASGTPEAVRENVLAALR
ncbi:MAG: adenylate kinase [Acidimicrobiaceae bacterium]